MLEYGIDDPAGIALLTAACECLDRMAEARAAIDELGLLVADRYGGRRANPACKLELDARNGFLAAMRALNLDLEPLRDRPACRPSDNGSAERPRADSIRTLRSIS